MLISLNPNWRNSMYQQKYIIKVSGLVRGEFTDLRTAIDFMRTFPITNTSVRLHTDGLPSRGFGRIEATEYWFAMYRIIDYYGNQKAA
jgi:hypothetical protein